MAESRNIPAWLKRKVLMDAGHRCSMPRCQTLVNVEIHHIVPFNKVQKHEYDNLIALCPNHHVLADNGAIDRQSLRMYKNNLQYAIDKYSTFELDVLISLSRSSQGIMPIPEYLDVLVKRILEAGLVELAISPKTMYVTHPTTIGDIEVKLNPNILHITSSGRDFVNRLSSENIGYEQDRYNERS
jgi:hypothetical protein